MDEALREYFDPTRAGTAMDQQIIWRGARPAEAAESMVDGVSRI
jgi:hypothetical protein